MFKYGSIIDDVHVSKDKEIYKLIASYYDNPTMTKVNNTDEFGVYVAKLPCLLINEYRYIFAMCLNDKNPDGTQVKLSDMKWDVLQARVTDKFYSLKQHTYEPKRTPDFAIPIKKYGTDGSNSFYKCETLPIEIILIHPEKNFIQYPESGTLSAALETFRTVITHK